MFSNRGFNYNEKLLSRAIPSVILRRSYQTAMLLSMALFAFIFIIVFRPFGIYRFVHESGILASFDLSTEEAFYIATTCVVLYALIIVGISRIIMVHYYRHKAMNYLQYIAWSFAEFILLAIFITGYSSTLFHNEYIVKIFINVFVRTFCILLIPYLYCFLYTVLVEKIQVVKHLRESIENDEAQQQKSYVLFNDDKGLRLSVKRDNLLIIESADNYICVWYQNNGTVKKAMVRNTMKRVAEQLDSSNIRRCHRSYMVNLDRVKVLRREKEGIFIELGLDSVPDIPISKTYADSITAWLMK